MMYPNQPQAYAPPMPQYPQQPAYPAQPYTQPAAPQYPAAPAYPQQYAAPPAPPQTPAQPLPTGTLDTFYSQPSTGGGPSWRFTDPNTRQPLIGKSYAGFVARPVTNADVRALTNDGGAVQTYKDGRPKFVMVVPMLMQPSPEFPEGQAGFWVKGQLRDELARAMAEAGAPEGPPEAGAFIRCTLVGTRPVPGRNPAYQHRVEYARPGGAPPVTPPPAPAAPQQAPVQPAQPVQVPPPVQQLPPPAPMPQAAPVAQQAAPVAPPAAAPVGFSPEQAELFAKLTGQPTS